MSGAPLQRRGRIRGCMHGRAGHTRIMSRIELNSGAVAPTMIHPGLSSHSRGRAGATVGHAACTCASCSGQVVLARVPALCPLTTTQLVPALNTRLPDDVAVVGAWNESREPPSMPLRCEHVCLLLILRLSDYLTWSPGIRCRLWRHPLAFIPSCAWRARSTRAWLSFSGCKRTPMLTLTCTWAPIRTHVHAHAHAHPCTRMHTHAHTHACTQHRAQWRAGTRPPAHHSCGGPATACTQAAAGPWTGIGPGSRVRPHWMSLP